MWKYEKAKQLIEKSPLRREELARLCGIKEQSLNNLLCGSHNPSRSVLILMAQALNTTVEQLEPAKKAKAG